ncbi:hypothetical protein C8F01DRAFT_454192 [Mycena amicta]|nr:hypothetical protein C8F01DRAFT_454192 [Mycena amicta]
MSDLSLAKATLIALVIETFNVGVFTVLFGACLRFIVVKKTFDVNGILTPTLCLIWVLTIAHWVVDIIRARIAFIDDPADGILYLSNPAQPLEGAKIGLYSTITIFADFFMIYRCWMVWNRNFYVLAVPVLSWIGTAVTGWVGTAQIVRTQKGGIFHANLVPWIVSFFSMSLATNVLCTFLIAWKVLQSQIRLRKMSSTHAGGRVIQALIVFTESAALYSLSLIALLVTYQLGINTSFIVLDLTSSLIGITFSSIILRLSMTSSAKTKYQVSNNSSLPPSSRGNPSGLGAVGVDSYPLSTVHVSRLVEVNRSDDWATGKGQYDEAKSATAV